MALEPFLRPELMFARPTARTRAELFQLLAEHAVPHLPGMDSPALTALLETRERQAPTATPEGVAFPHAVGPDIGQTLVAVVTLDPPLRFDERLPPASVVFCLFGSSSTPWEHVRLLARLARIASSPEARRRLREASSPEALLEVVREEDRRHG